MTTAAGACRGISLCALVIGLMAMLADSALAEAGAKWTVAGKDAGTLSAEIQLKELLKINAVEAEPTAILLTKIAGAKVWFLTHKTPGLFGVKLEGEGKLTTGKVTFKGVTTDLNEKASVACTPLSLRGNDASLGEAVTEWIRGELILHEPKAGVKEGVVRVLPLTGNVFATLYFGEECSLPESIPVLTSLTEIIKNVFLTGSGLVLKEPKGKLGTEEATHEIAENSLTALWAISVTEEHKATVDGSAEVSLSGAHAAMIWKGIPG